MFRGASTKKGLACAAVLVSVSVTACASEGGRPVDALGRSVAATEDAGTANVAITYTERIDSAPGGGGRFIIQSKGSLDFADQSGQVVVNAESNAELEAFEVRYIGAETFVEVPASEAAAVGAKANT